MVENRFIFVAWMAPILKNFEILGFFRHKNVTFIEKINFLTVHCRDSDTLGVFSSGELFASIIFDAWIGAGLNNLES